MDYPSDDRGDKGKGYCRKHVEKHCTSDSLGSGDKAPSHPRLGAQPGPTIRRESKRDNLTLRESTGSFTSKEALRSTVGAFISYRNHECARPFRWKLKGYPLQTGVDLKEVA